MSKKMIKEKKVFKKYQIIIIGIMILVIILLLFFLLKPIKIFVPSSNGSLEKIGVIDENRSVYTYHVKKVLVFPSLNEKMNTKEFLNGTAQTGFIWDGGTSINQGIGFVVVDCQDGLKPHRSSPVIITTKEYANSVISDCH